MSIENRGRPARAFLRLPAAAALALCAAGAHAQSSVTLYGILDSFVEFADNGDDHVSRVESGGVASSRWGLRGREDLGGGLAAFFGLEAGLSGDTGVLGQGGLAWGRLAQVGLSHSSLGQLSFGRQYTPFHYVVASYAIGGPGLGYANAANSLYYSPGTVARADNSVLYVTPNLGGLTGRVLVSAGEGSTGKAWSASLGYDNGPFSVAAAYYHADAPRGTPGTAATNPDDELKITALGGSYDFGVVKVALLYSGIKNEVTAFRVDQQWWSIGATFPIGASGSLLIDYGQLSNDAVSNADAKSFGIRYDHALSKRTTLYAGAMKMRNDAAAGYRTSGAGNSGVALSRLGADPTSVVFGVMHRF